jgi:hypothetical protein
MAHAFCELIERALFGARAAGRKTAPRAAASGVIRPKARRRAR